MRLAVSAAVVAEGLVKDYPRWRGPAQRALHGLSLSIPSGAAFGLIGPNGAGKTSFIKLVLGVSRPTLGTLTVLGGSPEDVSVRARIGYLPERLHLPSARTARSFLSSVASLKRLTVPRAELEALLERVGLGGVTQRIGTYSKGMRQRLGLAAALLGKPELLVLDEPTDGIDPLGRVDVRHLLLEEHRRGATLLLNSHLLSETERVCDRVGVLVHGRLRSEGTLNALKAQARSWRVRFSGAVDAVALGALGFRPEGAHFHFDGPSEVALNQALDQARTSGALLVELSPSGVDLESVLFGSVEGAAA